MFVRNRLAVVALAALPAALAAQGYQYAPTTGQYRVTQSTKATQEAMGQKQDFESSGNQLFTVVVARAGKDTLMLTATVDSVTQTGPMGPPPGIDKLVGVKAEAKLSPTGILYSTWTKDSSITGATALAEAAGRFLPRIRGRMEKGATWVDTSSGKVRQTGIEVDRKTVSKFTVAGDTTVAGEPSWKLTRDDSTTMSGAGMAQGQALTMEGTSTGKGTLIVSQKGVFFGGEGSEQANIKLLLSANGLEINIAQNANTKIVKVK